MRRPFKKLDDVVKAMDFCINDEDAPNCLGCPYADKDGEAACCGNDREDALYYLKVLQELMELTNSPAEVLNEPLEWTELKSMIGKPVWIVSESISVGVSPYWKDWYIIKSFSDDEYMYCNDNYAWAKETKGRMWQAFRRER